MLELLTSYILAFGIPLLGMIFILEGMLVGKLIPTRVILVLAIVIYEPNILYAPVLFLTATFFSTFGQYLLFRQFYGLDDHIKESSWIKISEDSVNRAEDLFERYGQKGIIFTNALPVVRGYLALPAAAEKMNTHKFIFYSFLGSFLYFSWVVGIGVFASEIILAG